MKNSLNPSAQFNKIYYLIKQNICKLSVFIIVILATCFLNSCGTKKITLKTDRNLGTEIAQDEKIGNVKIVSVKDKRNSLLPKWVGIGAKRSPIYLDTTLSVYIKESLNNLICKDTSINPSIPVSIEIDKFYIFELLRKDMDGKIDCVVSYLGFDFQYTFYYENNGIPKKVIFKDLARIHDCQDFHDYNDLISEHAVKLAEAFIKKINTDSSYQNSISNNNFNNGYEYDKLRNKNAELQADTVDMHDKWAYKTGIELSYCQNKTSETGYSISLLNYYRLPGSPFEYSKGIFFQSINLKSISNAIYSLNIPFQLKYYFKEPFYVMGSIAPGIAMLHSPGYVRFGSRFELTLGYNWTSWLSTNLSASKQYYSKIYNLPSGVGLSFGLNLSYPTFNYD